VEILIFNILDIWNYCYTLPELSELSFELQNCKSTFYKMQTKIVDSQSTTASDRKARNILFICLKGKY